ncbi:Clp protease N-terminal domain-containing protein [Micromonospora chersina]|uniref:Clp protease N-terminal domain-containing protein n=1 Tax=Micromonospora chersina TaxID=47854 RepID=UPI0037A87133
MNCWSSQRASPAAFRRGDPYAGTTHLLVGLLADPSGLAGWLLRLIDVDPEAALVVDQRRLPGSPDRAPHDAEPVDRLRGVLAVVVLERRKRAA